MKIRIYSIYDSAAATFGQPFFLTTDGIAKRSFQEAVDNKTGALAKHPEDYTLFRIGHYNDDNAEIGSTPPKKIITALEVVNAYKKSAE